MSRGSRVVVVGRLQQPSWTAEDGSVRSTVEVVAEELEPSLRWATAPRPGRPHEVEQYGLRDRQRPCLAVNPERYWAVAAESAP